MKIRKIEIFTGKKLKSCREKIGKVDFALTFETGDFQSP